MSEPYCVVSARTAGAPYFVPGTIQAHCAWCDAAVNVTPSGQKALAACPGVRSMCDDCWRKRHAQFALQVDAPGAAAERAAAKRRSELESN